MLKHLPSPVPINHFIPPHVFTSPTLDVSTQESYQRVLRDVKLLIFRLAMHAKTGREPFYESLYQAESSTRDA